ncbi:rhodanese-like domain-containing protein [Candidatus Nitrospira allomarina]|uniref:Rhodanese-like domain-containing protein n=1 Tax=Candidatus Nitrospira allomarina TaxID=3020900 RepID=A0AA96GDB7_9BACT|nr:rhodanese-like domain-containing protein [Candidatus Nitrospira allomarina]WNM59192.1 rhodanese-like domain-containing protein [Candidatus Nitrospira allomarina]
MTPKIWKPSLNFLTGLPFVPYLDTVLLWCVGLVVFTTLVSCSEKGLHDMTPEQLLASIETHTAPVIVDVRSQSEYDAGHVPGAVHLPFYAIWSRHKKINATPKDSIVVYCEHGPRAWIGKFALWTAGYQNIVYLDGHMSGWKQRGMPMINGAE